jgi:NTE family protein
MRAKAGGGGVKTITLALQGGAAHGAFVWGVLDRLLEEERLVFEGVSGTSSGAINAVLLAYGLIDGDRAAARALIGRFWKRISEESEDRRWTANMLFRLARSRIMQITRKDALFDLMSRILLPYDFDPDTMDPLRAVIAETVDFERLRREPTMRLFVNATNVSTNANRIFDDTDVSLEAVCASCCLPYLFDAVEVEGERYWDGGYMGNPTIYPLIYNCDTSDVVMVLTTPLGPKKQPETSADILTRVSEVSFTSTFMREMRAIAFVTDLIERELVSHEAGLRKIHMHAIAAQAGDPVFDVAQRFNAEWGFFQNLRDKGRAAADAWLADAFAKLGTRSSVDVETLFG